MVEPILVEPIINNWTIDHLLFGLITASIITLFSLNRHKVFLISSFIILLWELFEYRNSPTYWLSNYANNLGDIVVGMAGIIIIRGLIHLYESRKNGSDPKILP